MARSLELLQKDHRNDQSRGNAIVDALTLAKVVDDALYFRRLKNVPPRVAVIFDEVLVIVLEYSFNVLVLRALHSLSLQYECHDLGISPFEAADKSDI